MPAATIRWSLCTPLFSYFPGHFVPASRSLPDFFEVARQKRLLDFFVEVFMAGYALFSPNPNFVHPPRFPIPPEGSRQW